MSLRIILLLFLGTWSAILGDKAHHHTDPASDSLSVPVITSGYSSAPKASAPSSSVVAAAPPALSPDKLSSTVSELVSAVNDGASKDKLTERSDTYAAPSSSSSSSSYSAPAPAAPASTGNLYYYYYPVAAYPIYGGASAPHPSHGIKPKHRPSYGSQKQVLRNKDSSGSSHHSASSGGYGGLDEASDFTPFLFMIIPLVAATIAFLVLISIQGNNNNGIIGRSFDGGITSAFLGRSSELDEKFGSFADLQAEIDLLLGKYVQALDSDQCMDRIVCELGVKASRIPSKGLLFSVVEWLAPPNHALLGRERIQLMRTAATNQDYNMQTCQKFICHPPAVVRDGIRLEDLKLKLNKKKITEESTDDNAAQQREEE